MKIKNPILLKTLSSFVIATTGFVLINLVFILDGGISALVGLAINFDGPEHLLAIGISQILFLAALAVASCFIFKSKLPVILKASYLIAPAATVHVLIGATLSRWPTVSYSAGAIVGVAGLVYLYKTKQNWQFWFAWVIISLTMLFVAIAGVEI